jgi:hypothetical protein
MMTTTRYLGKTKIDKSMRISLIQDVATILNARTGDEIEYQLTNTEITIKKINTRTKRGIDQTIMKTCPKCCSMNVEENGFEIKELSETKTRTEFRRKCTEPCCKHEYTVIEIHKNGDLIDRSVQ